MAPPDASHPPHDALYSCVSGNHYESLSLLLDPADPLHADFLCNLKFIEFLQHRLGAPDWTEKNQKQLIRRCHLLRNQLCGLRLSYSLLVLGKGATPQRVATLEALEHF
jgi:hypothetical protein